MSTMTSLIQSMHCVRMTAENWESIGERYH